ncbi:unnamed protein product [Dibothriocephalus latus]|uniref:Uncharacterized protein n=1 Tax=Dibothriocephalus latus TaxID=60516 RepID=A0A3P7QKR7_DIBLA|nr:unnamed protein product [Dibothriocephalus latus]
MLCTLHDVKVRDKDVPSVFWEITERSSRICMMLNHTAKTWLLPHSEVFENVYIFKLTATNLERRLLLARDATRKHFAIPSFYGQTDRFRDLGVTTDGVERSSKVNKGDGRWLLVAMAEFKDPSQYEYLIHTSMPRANSGLVGSRPGVAHRLALPEENNGEDLCSNIDEAYAALFLITCLISPVVDRHKDA